MIFEGTKKSIFFGLGLTRAGKCMPDYSIIKSLCEELEVTVAELMDGEMSEEKSVRIYDDEQIL